MEVLKKIIDAIDADIAKYRGGKGDYINGAITGLSNAKLIIQRELIESGNYKAPWMGKEGYKSYLKSDHWLALRARMIKQASSKCTKCGSPDRLEVHHLSYDHLGQERDEDLEVLCNTCHEKAHGKEPEYPTQEEVKQLVSSVVERVGVE